MAQERVGSQAVGPNPNWSGRISSGQSAPQLAKRYNLGVLTIMQQFEAAACAADPADSRNIINESSWNDTCIPGMVNGKKLIAWVPGTH